ncbi:MAG TPA: VWA domain-containing protein [Candidatus Acidoferrales bacterium]|nr:VWA domain-containing protein [Candidatus Acidoferrales bacterium]
MIIRVTLIGIAVQDKQGKYVLDLSPDDFRILEDGQLQKILVFHRPEQITGTCIGILVDHSASRRNVLPNAEIEPTKQFLDAIVDKSHAASVMEFNDQRTPIGTYSNDPATVDLEMRDVESKRYFSGTDLYDAIEQATLQMSSMQGRRVLVVIAEGDDNDSRTPRAQAIEAALKSNAVVYFIQLKSSAQTRDERQVGGFVKEIVSSTGGELLSAKNSADIYEAFDAIKGAISSSYLLAYTPSKHLSEGVHRLDIKTTRKGVRVIAPTKVYAPMSAATANQER